MFKDQVEEQVISLLADDFVKLNVVPVQQQQNGSDCGVCASAYAPGRMLRAWYTCQIIQLFNLTFLK